MSTKPEEQVDQPSGYRPATHGNYAQWGAIVVALLVGVGGFGLQIYWHNSTQQSVVSDEHTNALIDAKLRPAVTDLSSSIDKKLAPFQTVPTDVSKLNGEVPELANELHQLSNKVDHLGDTILNQLIPKKITTNRDLEERLNGVSKFVEIAFKAKISSDPQETKGTGEELQRILRRGPLSPSLVQAGVSAAVHVAGYEIFSKGLITGSEPMLSNMAFEGPGLSNNFYTFLQVHGKGDARPLYKVTIKDFYQELDWVPWIDVTFNHVGVMYSGNDLYLSGAVFENCQFNQGLTGDPKRDELIEKVFGRLKQANNGSPINLLVANGEVFPQ